MTNVDDGDGVTVLACILGGTPTKSNLSFVKRKTIEVDTGVKVPILWDDSGTHGTIIMGMMEVCENSTLFFGLAGWNGFSINLDAWRKKLKNIQQILQGASIASAEWMDKIVHGKLGETTWRHLREEGLPVYFIPKAERLSSLPHIRISKQRALGSLATS